MGPSLAGVIVLVLRADHEIGRSVALGLGARGARVVAAGSDERALGEAVGEIAYAGGQARHAVGGAAEGREKAEATWGRLDFVVGEEAGGERKGSPEAVAEAIVAAVAAAVAGKAGQDSSGGGIVT